MPGVPKEIANSGPASDGHAVSAWRVMARCVLRPSQPLKLVRRDALEVGAPPGSGALPTCSQQGVMVTAEVRGWDIARGRGSSMGATNL